MFFKSQKKEYFTNCVTLGIDYKSDFDLNYVFDVQDELLKSEDANTLAINLSASFFLKNMKKIQKWKKSKSFEADCKDYEYEMKVIENYSSDNTAEKDNDFLSFGDDSYSDDSCSDDTYTEENAEEADEAEPVKEKYTGKTHDFLDGD